MTRPSGRLTVRMAPASIAIVGASERPSPGRSLITSPHRFGCAGDIYPVNPRHTVIAGRTCFPSILNVPHPPGVVAICLGPAHFPTVFPPLVERGASAAVDLARVT